jgi:WD40 repeat protein
LRDDQVISDRHNGEIFCCTFTPDGTAVLTAGWDGCLRFWNVATGDVILNLKAGAKPLAACGLTTDGKRWMSGSMEGILALWEAETQRPLFQFVAHTRPISAVVMAPDGGIFATASWDRQIVLRKTGREREGRTLSGHGDIVAGCRFTPDGEQLLSWSHDGTVRLWEVATARELALLGNHEDRVTVAAISPDGGAAVTASRDGVLKLWDLKERTEIACAKQSAEPRCVFFMLDGRAILTADANGWLVLLGIPSFEVEADLQTGQIPMCGDQAPSGELFALGGEDGTIRFVQVEEYGHAPLFVTPSQIMEESSNFLDKLLGKKRMTTLFRYVCPICRYETRVPKLPDKPVGCPMCTRQLRFRAPLRQLQVK